MKSIVGTAVTAVLYLVLAFLLFGVAMYGIMTLLSVVTFFVEPLKLYLFIISMFLLSQLMAYFRKRRRSNEMVYKGNLK